MGTIPLSASKCLLVVRDKLSSDHLSEFCFQKWMEHTFSCVTASRAWYILNRPPDLSFQCWCWCWDGIDGQGFLSTFSLIWVCLLIQNIIIFTADKQIQTLLLNYIICYTRGIKQLQFYSFATFFSIPRSHSQSSQAVLICWGLDSEHSWMLPHWGLNSWQFMTYNSILFTYSFCIFYQISLSTSSHP